MRYVAKSGFILFIICIIAKNFRTLIPCKFRPILTENQPGLEELNQKNVSGRDWLKKRGMEKCHDDWIVLDTFVFLIVEGGGLIKFRGRKMWVLRKIISSTKSREVCINCLNTSISVR